MSDVLKADIFFFVTTLAVVFVSLAIGIAAYYITKAAKEARNLTQRLQEDLTAVRAQAISVRKAVIAPARFMQYFIHYLFEERYK